MTSDNISDKPMFESRPCDSACSERFKVIRKYALNGHPQAMVLLATAYLTGEGREYNPERANFWLLRAQTIGSTKALWMRAHLFKAGLGVEQDLDKYHSLLDRAVYRDYGPALFAKAAESITQDGFNDNAVDMLKRAKADGYKQAAYLLAKMYETGQGIEQDQYEAAQIYQALSDYKESAKRFDVIKRSTKTSDPELFKKVESLGEIEIIEVIGQKISYTLQLDHAIELFKSSSFDRSGGTGSRIAYRKCATISGCRMAAKDPSESKALLSSAVKGGISTR